MSKLPRDVSGRELVRVLVRHFGYRQSHFTGSHIILDTDTPVHQRVPVPDHAPIRVGTLSAILRQVCEHKGCDRDNVLQHL